MTKRDIWMPPVKSPPSSRAEKGFSETIDCPEAEVMNPGEFALRDLFLSASYYSKMLNYRCSLLLQVELEGEGEQIPGP